MLAQSGCMHTICYARCLLHAHSMLYAHCLLMHDICICTMLDMHTVCLCTMLLFLHPSGCYLCLHCEQMLEMPIICILQTYAYAYMVHAISEHEGTGWTRLLKSKWVCAHISDTRSWLVHDVCCMHPDVWRAPYTCARCWGCTREQGAKYILGAVKGTK